MLTSFEFFQGFLHGLLLGICGGVLIYGYVRYQLRNRACGRKCSPVVGVLRDAEAWPAKLAVLEEKYGLLTKEIVFSHYKDDVSENVLVFEDAQILLLMGQPVAYEDIERSTLEFAGVYVVKIWVKGLEGHYLTLSSDNGHAANCLQAELEMILRRK